MRSPFPAPCPSSLALAVALLCAAAASTTMASSGSGSGSGSGDVEHVYSVASGGGTCGAIIDDCTDMQTCTQTIVGPCNGTEALLWGIVSEWQGLAYVDEANYLTDTNDTYTKVLPAGDSGFRDFNEITAGDATASYVMTGTVFGSSDDVWGYGGIASYLNTGNATFYTNENGFYVATQRSQSAVTRGDSSIGAPRGKYNLCVSPIANGACGANATYAPGAYKFSIFGHIQGSNVPSATASGTDGFPATQTHMGFRMKLSGYNFGSGAFAPVFNCDSANSCTALADLSNTQITSMRFVAQGEQTDYEFPQTFNYGSTANLEADAVARVGNGTGAVKIHASSSSDGTGVYIDYLFPLSAVGQEAGKYWVYDPTVTTTTAASTTAAPGVTATTTAGEVLESRATLVVPAFQIANCAAQTVSDKATNLQAIATAFNVLSLYDAAASTGVCGTSRRRAADDFTVTLVMNAGVSTSQVDAATPATGTSVTVAFTVNGVSSTVSVEVPAATVPAATTTVAGVPAGAGLVSASVTAALMATMAGVALA